MAFLAVAALAVLALALVGPGGSLAGLGAALMIGLLAGVAIAVNRRRGSRRLPDRRAGSRRRR